MIKWNFKNKMLVYLGTALAITTLITFMIGGVELLGRCLEWSSGSFQYSGRDVSLASWHDGVYHDFCDGLLVHSKWKIQHFRLGVFGDRCHFDGGRLA